MGGPQHQVGRFSGHRPRDAVDGGLVDGQIEQRAGGEHDHGYEGAVEQRQAEADGHTHAPWEIKGYTSHELRQQFPGLRRRLPTLWTRSRFISSVGTVTLDVVQAYIASQKGV